MSDRPITLVTRGSALALTQTRTILAQCQAAFPELRFEIQIVKTTGDRLQRTAPNPDMPPPAKGLFTKELEHELLENRADLAIHSLKDLPTELPDGLILGAVSQRVDVRDVLIYRDAAFKPSNPSETRGRGLSPQATVQDFPENAQIGTGSTRRQAQLSSIRPDFRFLPIRGNVGTRLSKLASMGELDGIVLAAAGLNRLHFYIRPDGRLVLSLPDSAEQGGAPLEAPDGLLASYLSVESMIPCVGQAAIGIEIRKDDPRVQAICDRLNDPGTLQCVLAERFFLAAMGGGCLSPIGAHAQRVDGELCLNAVSFVDGERRHGQVKGEPAQAEALARDLATKLKA